MEPGEACAAGGYPDLTPVLQSLGLRRDLPSQAELWGPITGSSLMLSLALLQNAGPHARAVSARTSVSAAKGGFTCTKGNACPPVHRAP